MDEKEQERYRHWRVGELAALRCNYGVLPVHRIAERLGRTPSAVHQMAHKAGIKAARRP